MIMKGWIPKKIEFAEIRNDNERVKFERWKSQRSAGQWKSETPKLEKADIGRIMKEWNPEIWTFQDRQENEREKSKDLKFQR